MFHQVSVACDLYIICTSAVGELWYRSSSKQTPAPVLDRLPVLEQPLMQHLLACALIKHVTLCLVIYAAVASYPNLNIDLCPQLNFLIASL